MEQAQGNRIVETRQKGKKRGGLENERGKARRGKKQKRVETRRMGARKEERSPAHCVGGLERDENRNGWRKRGRNWCGEVGGFEELWWTGRQRESRCDLERALRRHQKLVVERFNTHSYETRSSSHPVSIRRSERKSSGFARPGRTRRRGRQGGIGAQHQEAIRTEGTGRQKGGRLSATTHASTKSSTRMVSFLHLNANAETGARMSAPNPPTRQSSRTLGPSSRRTWT